MNNNKSESDQIYYAGFWTRLWAFIIDVIIINIISFVIGLLAFFLIGKIFLILIPIVYTIWFWKIHGQTPGKMLLGIKILRLDGSPLGVGGAISRYIGYIISTIIAYIGFIVIAFHPKKQGLHDLIAQTIVVEDHGEKTNMLTNEDRDRLFSETNEIMSDFHGI